MSRPNKARSIGDEANLARRIAAERQSRGLSYDGLAKLMTEVGCAIQGSAIFKIEKANPPRRITVDELIGFATVFEKTVDNLLTPIEVLELHRAREILKRMDDADNDWLAAITLSLKLYTEFFVIAASQPELTDYIEGHRFHHFVEDEDLERVGGLFDFEPEAGGHPGALLDAISALWSQLRIQAMAVADFRLRRGLPEFYRDKPPSTPPWDEDPSKPIITPFAPDQATGSDEPATPPNSIATVKETPCQ